MIIKKTDIPYSQLKRSLQAFTDTQVELFNNDSVFLKEAVNRASYSKTERPFIGYKRNDSAIYIESQLRSYSKSTYMFYFILKDTGEHIQIQSGIRLKTWLGTTLILLAVIFLITLGNAVFNPRELREVIIIALTGFLTFTIAIPVIYWYSDRLKLYKGLVRQYDG